MKSDELNRQPFIDLLKSIIDNQITREDGYSIAIDGEWGCGKSWVLSELEKQLDNNYLTFHYDAWKNDFYEEPLVAILSVLISSLKDVKKINEKNSSSKIISKSITTLIKVTGSVVEKKWGFNPADALESAKDVTSSISDKRLTKEDFNQLLPLEYALDQIKDILLKLSKSYRILIIVDELDRCLPEYAIKVLQRLHHICNEMPIFQIIAIDKKQLADGISKVYGKHHAYKQGIIDEYILQFANNYLQKFVDIIIPLQNGMSVENENILCGLDELFEPYVRNDNVGRQLIICDKNFLLSFITSLMKNIDKRTQIKIFEQVRLCHKLTIATGKSMEYYLYPHLIYEVLCCIQVYCFHSKHKVFVKETKNRNSGIYLSLTFYDYPDYSHNPYIEKYNAFNNNLIEITKLQANVQNLNQITNFEIRDTITFLYRYYIHPTERFFDPLQNMFIDFIDKDLIFLDAFNEMLWKLN